MKIIFFGTSTFAAKTLSYLVDNQFDIVAIVTRPDRPKGRGRRSMAPPVKDTAQQLLPTIPLFQPEKASAPEFAEMLASFDADLFVVVAYGEIIRNNLLSMPKLDCINVHASLLPKYRGAAPIQRCLINGEQESGVTIMKMVRKMDAGDMIKSVKVPVGSNTTFGELEEDLCREGCRVLVEVLETFSKDGVTSTSQNHDQATYAPKVELEDCQIDWIRPSQDIHNLVRGVTPYPGAWCYARVRGQKRRIKMKNTRLEMNDSGSPGQVMAFDQEGMVIACGQGCLRVLEMQIEGKKMMTVKQLSCGFTSEDFVFNSINE